MRGASILLAVALLVTASLAAWGQTYDRYSSAELDELLGPIALYPDPLIAQILPAATYIDELETAYYSRVPAGSIDYQPWDTSVRAVAHYPSVLRMMATNPDWTIAVGQAYVSQPTDVTRSIQRLRARARNLGYLSSNAYQTVSVSGGYISILPAQPRYIYVPTYNPNVVYVQRRPSSGSWISFGAGLLIGAWLNNAFDWHRHRVYHHGWRGGGWIGRSRPYVRDSDRYYVNPGWRDRTVWGNRGIRSRDITNYRREIRRSRDRYRPPGVTTQEGTRAPAVPRSTPGRRPGEYSPRATTPSAPVVAPTVPRVPGRGPAVRTSPPGTRRAVPAVRPERGRSATSQQRVVTPRRDTEDSRRTRERSRDSRADREREEDTREERR